MYSTRVVAALLDAESLSVDKTQPCAEEGG